jgi:hypothetical protein
MADDEFNPVMERNQVLGVAVFVLALLVGGYIYNTVATDSFAATNPQANLDFEHHPADESVTVIHRKGESYDRLNTRALEVYVFPVDELKPSSPRTPIPIPFAEGDAATISNVTDNDRVVVLWRGESNSHVLGNYTVRGGENE